MKVPVAKPYLGREEEEAVKEVLRSGWFSQGPKVQEFEAIFADYVGARFAIATSSCTAALHISLLVAGVGDGDEVICPSFSFIATANSILYCGAKPVFVDIDPSTYNIDPELIKPAISPRTRAILPVHQLGLPAHMDELLETGERDHIPVIEDAAPALGAIYKGRRIGAPHGLLACFSFHPRKTVTTGEGGMITTNDADIARKLRFLRHHGMSVSDLERHRSSELVIEKYEMLGYNYRMSDIHAAVGIVQMKRLEDILKRRRTLAAGYDQFFKGYDFVEVPYDSEELHHSYQSYMIKLKKDTPIGRDELMRLLLEAGISSRRGVMLAHRESFYIELLGEQRLPVSEYCSDNCVILPLYPSMEPKEQKYVLEKMEAIFNER